MTTTLLTDIRELALPRPRAGDSRTPIDIVEDAALLIEGGSIIACGKRSNVEQQTPTGASHVSLDGRVVMPGLVDSHTHAVFAGQRVDEFVRRGRGESYEEIAAAGGGIRNTARAFVEDQLDRVVNESQNRIQRLFQLGTTTVEVKTGYGLSVEAELKHLEAILRTKNQVQPEVMVTLLAHVPPKTESSRDYLSALASSFTSRQADLDFIDIFVEATAFSPDDARYFRSVMPAQLPIKLHVDQLHDGAGAALAAELSALSADHLEFTSEAGMRALREGGVIGTILPGCGLFLHGSQWPDAAAMRRHGVEIAIATDLNPGSSHIENLWMCALVASTHCGLTLEESLWGVTRGGALALGREDLGSLEPGSKANFLVLDGTHWACGLYSPHAPPIHEIWINGAPARSA